MPAWWVISRSACVQRQPIRYGYLVGLIYFGGTFWWISNVTAIGAFFLVLYLALYPALWFLLVARLIFPGGTTGRSSLQIVDPRALFHALAAAALWILLEWWRSWFLTGFNWNELGISQAPSIVFRQLAAFGGVHLISFVLVIVNILWAEGLLAMAQTLREKRVIRASLPFAAALLVVAITFALGWHHLQRHRGETFGPSLRFACVQPNIPQIPYDSSKPYIDFQHTEDAALAKTEQLSLQAVAAQPELLIWPEATIDEGVLQDRPITEAMLRVSRAFNGYFLLGSQDFDENGGHGHKLYNAAYLFTPHGEQFQEYRKTRLVILGEFLPFGDIFPGLRKSLGIGMDFTPGPGPVKFEMNNPAVSFAPLICFEDTLASVADKAARLNPDFFITITNDGWYTGWCAAWGVRQHLQHAVFRCIEHDLPMIRCANTGISCVVNQDGTVTDRYLGATGEEIDVGGVFADKLASYPPQGTIYEAWGDWIVLISALISGMLALRFCRRLLVK